MHMSTVGEEPQDYFNQTAPPKSPKVDTASDSDSEDEQTLSFGSKLNTSQKVSKGLAAKARSEFKPLTSLSDAKKSDSITTAKTTDPGDRLWQTMEKLTGPGKVVMPHKDSHPDRKLLACKYKVFLDQCYKQQEYRKMVDEVEAAN